MVVALHFTACMDLDVTNINEPDSERALATPGDVASLIADSYHTWFQATHGLENSFNNATPGFFLSNQTFQHSAPWANAGMEFYARIPRNAIPMEPTHQNYGNAAFAWRKCYQAISALANGLEALEAPGVAKGFSDSELIRYKAYGKFVQGLAHGTIALLYDQGFILDESTDLSAPQVPVDYGTLMDQAFAYFDEAIALASSTSFGIPYDWMQAEMDSQGLVRFAYSMKARFRAQAARTPAERNAANWDLVIADVDRGILSTHTIEMDWDADWYSWFLDYSTWYLWGQLPYWVYGMADQSGAVAEWYALPLEEKRHLLPDGRPVLIVTPDLRFPQGSTVEEQRTSEGRFFRIVGANEESGGLSAWKVPERGVWRWSWYKAGYGRGFDYYELVQYSQPTMTFEEMRLLKAEGLYRKGDLAGAAAIINETRVVSGLNPTDASGTNTSCVPKLPDGSCGDLWEILKWEKRMETVLTGIAGVGWFFDGRGWGDLWKDTPLQLPIPCLELEVLGMKPCYTFGGPGGDMGSPGSTYHYPFEG